MDLNYSTNLIFPVPIHQIDTHGFDEIKDELIDYAYDLKRKEPIGKSNTNRGGWQSSVFDVGLKDDKLHEFLINSLVGLPPFKKSIDFTVKSWININKPGDYNVSHNHPNCNLAGVLWIKAPKNSGKIVFDSPNNHSSYHEIESYSEEFKYSSNIYQTFYFIPTEGTILIFPSYLRHLVEENKSEEDRISVSFNIQLK